MNNPATSNTTPADPERQEDFHKPVLKVIGLGGGGCNAVNRMIELGLKDVEFIAANTDQQVLRTSLAPVKIQLGPVLTRGLGAGGRPEVGEAAACESATELKAALAGADMIFLTAGMGGGTGTGAVPVAAEIARQTGAITVGIVTTPFSFEVGRRQKNAAEGLKRLNPHCDTMIAISNDRLLQVRGGNITIDVAFRVADDVLRQAVQGVTELVTESGLINVDFAHIKRLMKMGGGAFLAIGQGEGEGKALQAVQNALKHPLLESVSLEDAAGILVNFTGGEDLAFQEVAHAFSYLQEEAGSNLEIVMGMVNDERMVNRAQAILIVTGIGARPIQDVLPGAERIQAARGMPAERLPLTVPRTTHAPHLPELGHAAPVMRQIQESYEWQDTSRTNDLSGGGITAGGGFTAGGGVSSDALLTSDNLDIPAFLRRRKGLTLRGENAGA